MAINIVRTSELAAGRAGVEVSERGIHTVETPGGNRAVVVRHEQDGHGDRNIRQCLAYVERNGLRLVGVADAEGALRMVMAGDADVLVAVNRNHVALPAYVRLVSDEHAAFVPATQRRPQRRRSA